MGLMGLLKAIYCASLLKWNLKQLDFNIIWRTPLNDKHLSINSGRRLVDQHNLGHQEWDDETFSNNRLNVEEGQTTLHPVGIPNPTALSAVTL